MNKSKIDSLNQQIWEQIEWGNNKVAKLLEEDLIKELA